MTQQAPTVLARMPDISGSGGTKIIRTDFGRITTTPPFSPLDLTGLILWLDMSVTSSLTLSSGKITSAIDQSSNALTANAAGIRTPTYSATGFNTSYPAMTDDTSITAGGLEISSFPMGTGNTLTAWAVGTNSGSGASTNSNGRVLSYAAPGTRDFDSVDSWCFTHGGGFGIMEFTRNHSNILPVTNVTLPHIYIITVNSSGLVTIYVDGVSAATDTVAGNWDTGGVFAFGKSAGANSDFWDGALAECGVCTAYHDSTVVGQLYTYLKTKWGL